MRTLVDGLREMVHLIGDTFRLWWKNLLPMTTWWVAGFTGFTFNNNVYKTPEQIAVIGDLLQRIGG